MELSGVPNPDLVLDSNGPCSILVGVAMNLLVHVGRNLSLLKGLSTPEPVLQLGSYIFKGRYEGKFGAYIPHHKRFFFYR